MEVGFHKFLQLFVANGYFVFENDICVDLSYVPGVEPDCANSPLIGFFAKARCPTCPGALQSRSSRGFLLRREESPNIIFQTLLFLPLFPFSLSLFSFDN